MEEQYAVRDHQKWVAVLTPAASLSAFGIVGFLYATVLASAFPFSTKPRDIALFLFGASVLPALAAFVQSRSARSDIDRVRTTYAETVNMATTFAFLVGLSALTVALWTIGAGETTWLKWSLIIVRTTVTANLLIQIFGVWRTRATGRPLPLTFDRAWQAALFVTFFAAAAVLLFNVNLEDPAFNSFFHVFVDPPFIPHAGKKAVAIALLMIGTTAGFACLEVVLERTNPARLRRYQRIGLLLSIITLFIAFFDFKLELEPLHYLTNVGPALHVLSGGTLMVDTFSQYGPGPVAATLLAFAIGPHTLGTTQVLTQLFNLSFCAIWLICLFRMTRRKIASLLLGLMAIGLILGAWAYGASSINIAPSIFGFRYWPAMAMCLAISCLRPGARMSRATFAVCVLAGLWSIESLVATLAVHGAFILFMDLRGWSFKILAYDSAMALAPVGASVAILSVYTLVSAGAMPDYVTYLEYLTAYNPLSDFWAHPTSPLFLAWMTMLLAVFLVFAQAWLRVFVPSAGAAESDNDLFQKFVPMATLTVAMAAYYVSRSYDYTLLIAALPFATLAIPALIRFESVMLSARGPIRILALLPALIAVPTIAYAVLDLGRPAGPNSFFLQECRDRGRCTIGPLMTAFSARLRMRELFDQTGNPLADRWFGTMQPPSLVHDAVIAIKTQAKDDGKITVLLGENIAAELALLHTGKWQRWPISFAFTDGLVSRLAERIPAAPIHLQPGEFVLVRRDEDKLPFIEGDIIRRIRKENTLCALPQISQTIVTYRVAGATGCPVK